MATSPLVSILIPCFNAEAWVDEAVESALAQDYSRTEVIVHDDGSTDGSLDVIRRFEGRIRISSGPNRGGNAARNRLLQEARGEWLQYLDADDALLPDKISGQMAVIATSPTVDVLYGPVTMEYRYGGPPRREQLVVPRSDVWVQLARWHLPQTGAPLWRKTAIESVGGWTPDQPCCQEHDLYLRLLMSGKRFRYADSGGAIYRHWGAGTVSTRNQRQVISERLKIEHRAEQHLKASGLLTDERHSAINQARFEMARLLWHIDREQARQTIAEIRRSQPAFRPGSIAAPPLYRAIHGIAGFVVAEHVADLKRWVMQPLWSAPLRQGK